MPNSSLVDLTIQKRYKSMRAANNGQDSGQWPPNNFVRVSTLFVERTSPKICQSVLVPVAFGTLKTVMNTNFEYWFLI